MTLGTGAEMSEADAIKKMRSVLKEAKSGVTTFTPEELALIREWVPPTLSTEQIKEALAPAGRADQGRPQGRHGDGHRHESTGRPGRGKRRREGRRRRDQKVKKEKQAESNARSALSSEIDLQAKPQDQRGVDRRQSRMEHLQVRREVAAGRDPQVVEELDPLLVPEPRYLALGLRAGPEIVEPDAEEYRPRGPAAGCSRRAATLTNQRTGFGLPSPRPVWTYRPRPRSGSSGSTQSRCSTFQSRVQVPVFLGGDGRPGGQLDERRRGQVGERPRAEQAGDDLPARQAEELGRLLRLGVEEHAVPAQVLEAAGPGRVVRVRAPGTPAQGPRSGAA